ncbi:hypothetical protein HPB47_024894 [Ixodes persulcatus]|uniref:Uncharacterized protein n=1 Tax=Ixodes persulcatus TaxID=34615 RepID=A0AC60Q3B0_IXOPE|nr:hypothetical protein HPB47_024894 [Ixodes persulcatus]
MERELDGLLLRKRLVLLQLLVKKRARVERKWWVRPIFEKRREEGLYHTAMKRMRDGDVDFFVRFYRMTPPTFDELHDMVKEDLTRQFFIREPLPSEERLAIALSYLSSGQQIKDVALLYRVGLETARQAVHVTCRALWERLHQPFMKMSTAEIAELQRTVADIATSVAALATRLPPVASEEVELQQSERSATPDLDPLGPGEEPHAWLGRPTEGRPREVDPAVLDFLQEHWGAEGRAERCRAALTSFPRPRLPFATMPELNPKMKALAKERSRRPEGGSEVPANITARDQALKEGQDAVAVVMGPLDTSLRGAGAEVVYCLTRGAPKGPNLPRARLNHQDALFPGHGKAMHSQAWAGEPTWLGVRGDATLQTPAFTGAPCGENL